MAGVIIGRRQELSIVERFFASETAEPRALLLKGEAGIGKSTLWRAGVDLAKASGRTLTSRPSEAEAQLSFTVLGDLFAPVVDGGLAALPALHRRALDAALLLDESADHRPDLRAVSLAILGLIRSLASEAPLTIAIDDLQWIDRPSARALAFAIGRLQREPVFILAAMRTERGLTDPIGLARATSAEVERVAVGPIDRRSFGLLLRGGMQLHVAPPLVQRIYEASAGNPLYALEIGRALAQSGRNHARGEPLPLPADLQELMLARLEPLSQAARTALLFAASSAAPTTSVVVAAGADAEGLREAEEAGIITRRAGRIEFTHPLFASAAYAAATSAELMDTHEGLAGTASEPEETARHRALAAQGPEEAIAESVEEAAERAEARGAPSAASELYALAASVTPSVETDRLWFRRYKSAACLFAAGDAAGSMERFERIQADLGPGLARATTLYVMANGSWNDLTKVGPLLERSLADAGGDPLLLAEIEEQRAWVALLRGEPEDAVTISDRAIALLERVEGPEPQLSGALRGALSARALAGTMLGRDSIDLLRRGIELEGQLTEGEISTPRAILGRIQTWMGDLESARALLHRELDRYLEQGHASGTWEIHVDLADLEFRAGRWADASDRAREAEEIATEAGASGLLGQILPVKAMIAGACGDLDGARADAAEALAMCVRMGDRWHELRARATLGFLEITDGDPSAAHAWLEPAVEIHAAMGLKEPAAILFHPDAVEARAGVGDVEGAAELADLLETQATTLGRPNALAIALRCRAIVAAARRDLDDADDDLQRALEAHASLSHPFDLGRCLLVAGEVHRRMRRHGSSRDLLARATEVFQLMGAEPWAVKAARELRRVGGRRPSPTDLTPAEEEVAHLVAEGRTNREVASALFLSVHTVDAHLRRVYRKLHVRSRTELARKL